MIKANFIRTNYDLRRGIVKVPKEICFSKAFNSIENLVKFLVEHPGIYFHQNSGLTEEQAKLFRKKNAAIHKRNKGLIVNNPNWMTHVKSIRKLNRSGEELSYFDQYVIDDTIRIEKENGRCF